MTPATVQCVDCQRFTLKGHPGMASQGYGKCGLSTGAAHFESATFQRHCAGFRRAPADVSKQRRAWLDDRREQFNQSIDKVTP